jgi:hypothetical protein
MATTPNLGLTAWESQDDFYNHSQLSGNFYILDSHDHTEGRGRRIVTDALADQAVTPPKLADGAVLTVKIADGQVTSPKYAPGSVDTTALKDAGVTTPKIADRSVTAIKLAEDILPIGTVIPWWRPSIATPIPAGWEVADGHQLTSGQHDFGGGGTITLPDLRNRFILGAATGGTGTSPTTPPAIGQAGGSNNASLAHSHVIDAHTHTVPHSHTVNPHSHVVAAHRHQVEAHSHTVDAHAHLVPGHTHPIPSHTHGIDHSHYVYPHSHGIAGDGNHYHGFGGGFEMAQRPYYVNNSSGEGTIRQAAYLAGYNEGGGSSIGARMDQVGWHSHGGSTHGADASTAGPSTSQSGAWSGSTNANNAFNTGNASPGTSASAPFTSMESPATNAVTATTTVETPVTSAASGGTSTALASVDIRPGFIGLLFLIKVRR